MSWMSNHFYLYGGAGYTSMEAKEYNFGSIKPGTLHPHMSQKFFHIVSCTNFGKFMNVTK